MLIQFYLIAALYLLIPVGALIILRIRHKFRITSIIGGIAGFFLAMRILMTVINVLLSSIGVTAEFWEQHVVLNKILNIVFNVLFQNVSLYLIMKYVMKDRMSIYDGMAMGISYCLGNCFIQGYYFIYASRLWQSFQAGTLAELASEALPLESLQETVDEIVQMGMAHYYLQLFNAVVIIFMSMTLCIFLYHSLRKPDKRFLFLALGVQAVCLALIEISLSFTWLGFYPIADVLVLALIGYLFYRYMSWYRQQQRELLERKKAYREYIKNK